MSLVTRHFLSFLVAAAASSVALAGRRHPYRYVEDDSWWADRAAVFYPTYQLALQPTQVSIASSPITAPDAILATVSWTALPEEGLGDWAPIGDTLAVPHRK